MKLHVHVCIIHKTVLIYISIIHSRRMVYPLMSSFSLQLKKKWLPLNLIYSQPQPTQCLSPFPPSPFTYPVKPSYKDSITGLLLISHCGSQPLQLQWRGQPPGVCSTVIWTCCNQLWLRKRNLNYVDQFSRKVSFFLLKLFS